MLLETSQPGSSLGSPHWQVQISLRWRARYNTSCLQSFHQCSKIMVCWLKFNCADLYLNRDKNLKPRRHQLDTSCNQIASTTASASSVDWPIIEDACLITSRASFDSTFPIATYLCSTLSKINLENVRINYVRNNFKNRVTPATNVGDLELADFIRGQKETVSNFPVYFTVRIAVCYHTPRHGLEAAQARYSRRPPSTSSRFSRQ